MIDNDRRTYPHPTAAYINGNVIRAQAVNLPFFVQPARLEEADNYESLSFVAAPETEVAPARSRFKVPVLVQINRMLQMSLIVLCVLAIGSYSWDVVSTSTATKMQEQARRLSEQNSELSAKLLHSISFQGIQESVLGRAVGPANLHVPDEVLVANEIPPVKAAPFKPAKHYLPLLSGY